MLLIAMSVVRLLYSMLSTRIGQTVCPRSPHRLLNIITISDLRMLPLFSLFPLASSRAFAPQFRIIYWIRKNALLCIHICTELHIGRLYSQPNLVAIVPSNMATVDIVRMSASAAAGRGGTRFFTKSVSRYETAETR